MQIGAWQILANGASVDETCKLVNAFGPFAVFRDASNIASDFRLTPEDCLRVRVSCPSTCPSLELGDGAKVGRTREGHEPSLLLHSYQEESNL